MRRREQRTALELDIASWSEAGADAECHFDLSAAVPHMIRQGSALLYHAPSKVAPDLSHNLDICKSHGC